MEQFAKAIVGDYPNTIDLFKVIGPPLLPLVVAVVVAVIQYNQWKAAKEKLRIDLFDKRMSIYNELYISLFDKFMLTSIPNEERLKTRQAVNSCVFLFPEDVSDTVRRLAANFDEHRVCLAYILEDDNRLENKERFEQYGLRERQLSDEMDLAYKNFPELFKSSLDFGHIKR